MIKNSFLKTFAKGGWSILTSEGEIVSELLGLFNGNVVVISTTHYKVLDKTIVTCKWSIYRFK